MGEGFAMTEDRNIHPAGEGFGKFSVFQTFVVHVGVDRFILCVLPVCQAAGVKK